jgi:hypothetical protein
MTIHQQHVQDEGGHKGVERRRVSGSSLWVGGWVAGGGPVVCVCVSGAEEQNESKSLRLEPVAQR